MKYVEDIDLTFTVGMYRTKLYIAIFLLDTCHTNINEVSYDDKNK